MRGEGREGGSKRTTGKRQVGKQLQQVKKVKKVRRLVLKVVMRMVRNSYVCLGGRTVIYFSTSVYTCFPNCTFLFPCAVFSFLHMSESIDIFQSFLCIYIPSD